VHPAVLLVIERFKDAPAIYKRIGAKGRMMPAVQ